MASLALLRRELRPAYGKYTDAVISLIGLEADAHVLEAAKARDLAEAHAAQNYLWTYPKRTARPDSSRYFLRLAHWPTDAPPTPAWLSKIPPVKRKLPEITAEIKWGTVYFRDSKGINVGLASIEIVRDKEPKLVVKYLQQTTKALATAEARKLEGWKHKAMMEFERIARQRRCNEILFSTGEEHAKQNIGVKLIHGEILETYGRLPLQHSYRLRHVSHKIRLRTKGGELGSLWWVKRVKAQ